MTQPTQFTFEEKYILADKVFDLIGQLNTALSDLYTSGQFRVALCLDGEPDSPQLKAIVSLLMTRTSKLQLIQSNSSPTQDPSPEAQQ
jgi:hypothetical protein